MLGDDPFAKPLEGKACQGRGQPVVALPKRAQELCVAVREGFRQLALERDEERALRRRTTQQDEPVVRDPHER